MNYTQQALSLGNDEGVDLLNSYSSKNIYTEFLDVYREFELLMEQETRKKKFNFGDGKTLLALMDDSLKIFVVEFKTYPDYERFCHLLVSLRWKVFERCTERYRILGIEMNERQRKKEIKK